MNLCLCGCGQRVIKEGNKYINGHNQRGKTKENNEGVKRQAKKLSKQMIGRTKENDERFKKVSEKLKGRSPSIKGFTKETHEGVRRQSEWMKNGGALYVSSFVTEEGKKRRYYKLRGKCFLTEEGRKKKSEVMKREVTRIHKLIKRVSKDELTLRMIVKELYPTSEYTYQILNYDVDVVIPEYKIAIEFDGYYHFDTEDHRKYHEKRQKEIEQEGWKFIRYTMFDKFPSKEKVKEDMQMILEKTK